MELIVDIELTNEIITKYLNKNIDHLRDFDESYKCMPLLKVILKHAIKDINDLELLDEIVNPMRKKINKNYNIRY